MPALTERRASAAERGWHLFVVLPLKIEQDAFLRD